MLNIIIFQQYSSLLIVICFIIVSSVAVPAAFADREHESHGGRAPSERFRDEHIKDGRHDPHLDHQAILGSKHEAEQFDHLDAAESQRKLRLLAVKMDTNSDGYVDRTELVDWIHRSMLALDQEETDERFDDVDDNHDGYVTWIEYARDAFLDEDEPDRISTEAEDVKLMDEDRGYFNAADIDGDSRLNKNEFAAFQNPEHHTHMHDTLIAITMKEKDLDRDGRISMNEFMGEIGDSPNSEWYVVERDRFQQDYDKDHDGYLDSVEMRAWLVPDTKQTSIEETEHLFAQTDKNHDDRLSYDEIVDEYRTFVGSEATNYGEHLEKVHEEL